MSVLVPLPLLPLMPPPAPVPAYVDGCTVFYDYLRHVGALRNSVRAVCRVDYSQAFDCDEPTSGVWQRLDLRSNEALVQTLTDIGGSSIVSLSRHGRETTRIAVDGPER